MVWTAAIAQVSFCREHGFVKVVTEVKQVRAVSQLGLKQDGGSGNAEETKNLSVL